MRALHEPPAHLNKITGVVIGAAIEVHRDLGPGFLESTYETALRIELESRGVAVEQQVVVPIMYKKRQIAEARLDLVVEGEVVLEIKAVERFDPVHRAQLLSYLRAGAFQLGLLINFNVEVLRDGIQRMVSSG